MSTEEPKLRIGTITGSLRKGSFSRVLAESLPALSGADIEISEMPTVGALPLFDQDLLDEDGVPQTVADLAEAVRAVDGLIIVSPEYNWSIPGALKNALDWLSRLESKPTVDKPVTIFTCSPGLLGGARAHPPIRNVLHALDCRILARPEVQISNVKAKIAPNPSRLTDLSTAEFVTQRIAAFAEFVRA
ncbi:NADPH-dependent FMN reductase [Leisingera sp. ANG59]|uniref:NADPH-dependent FMN reductase n=1 Tax=Leisingera sp. ANG59 TaxID=2675221 RepID=UPI0015733F2C|nr:NADPH-dependent FMN reductase [Leisingera sp. ANG59]NSY39351.1 hypothetical protein [Leisingera sp. ANG59]